MANGNKKWVSDIIGETYRKWKNNCIVLDCDTGTGKTYFVLHILLQYAYENNKKFLYLCNRKELQRSVIEESNLLDSKHSISVWTYQYLQNQIQRKQSIPYYDYIIADECHYFTVDALFNEYTDLSYTYLKNQSNSVVLYISATAKVFFKWLQKTKKVDEQYYYKMEKSYQYVDKVFFYRKSYLIPKVNEILQSEKSSKIIIFCNSIMRMQELYKEYGENANYKASDNAKKVKTINEPDCIYRHKDGTVTFDKRILVTTKVLDNGIDIKDRNVKHIFSEILDIDSAIQAIGRKRPFDEEDTCTFYIKDYSKQAIQGLLNTNQKQLEPAFEFKYNYSLFKKKYENNRLLLRYNKIIYFSFNDKKKNEGKLMCNQMRFNKYCMDNTILQEMKDTSYQYVMSGVLGNNLAAKIEQLDILIQEKDDFLDFLKSIEGKYLYSNDRKEIVKNFKKIGVNLRREGINTLNGALDDYYGDKYKYRFRNKKIDEYGKVTKKVLVDKRKFLKEGAPNPYRDKTYWLLELKAPLH